MAKKGVPKKYVKLGPVSGGFSDPYSLFKIARGQVKQLVTIQERTSGKIKAAIRGGHLVVVTEGEYEEYLESLEPQKEVKSDEDTSQNLEEELDEKTKAQLTEYYKEHYEVTDEQVADFEKLKHDDMVIELLDLKKETEE